MSDKQNTKNENSTHILGSFGDNSILIGSVTGGTINFNLQALSFEAVINQLKPISENTSPNPMHYLSGGVGFYGRDDELLWMDSFCKTNLNVQYAILYGVGGVGKSKFMYEYIKSRMCLDWHMCFITDDIISSLLFFPNYYYHTNLLLVVDYASRNSEIIGKWISKLSTTDTISNKVRVVLIERQGQNDNLEFTPWIEKLYGNTTQRRLLKHLEYGFLQLNQIDNPCLRYLINDYIEANYPYEQLNADEIDGIIEYASYGLDIDKKRQSPLMVLLVTDAYVSGQDYRNWNIALLVQNYIKKQKENWLTALCDNNTEVYKSLIELLVFATVVGNFDINAEIPDLPSSALARLTENPLCKGILEGSTGYDRELVHAVEPNIIGEYFVLDYLNSLVTFKSKREHIVSFYSRPFNLLDFIGRCIDDFFVFEVFNGFWGNYIELIKPSLIVEPFNEIYALLLGRYFYHCDSKRKENCKIIMEQLHIDEAENNRQFIVGTTTIYAWLLADFTSIEGLDDYIDPIDFSRALHIAKGAIIELEQLNNKYSEKYPKILLAYSKALANFSNYSSESESYDCVSKLQTLYNEICHDDSDVAVSYAMSLNNYIMVLGRTPSGDSPRKAKMAISQLADLYERHIRNAINVSVDLDKVEFVNAFSNPKLRNNFDSIKEDFLVRANMYQEKVATEYAKGLNNLIGLYTQIDKQMNAFECFNILKEIYLSHGKKMSTMKIDYAKAIANIIHICEANSANDMLEELRNFYIYEERNQEIYAVRYINALANRLSRILKDGIYIDDVDAIFNEACAIYFENFENDSCSLDITKRYSLCVYYMFNILIRTQHYDKDGDELELLYETLVGLYEKSDPRLRTTIGQYLEYIDEMFQ